MYYDISIYLKDQKGTLSIFGEIFIFVINETATERVHSKRGKTQKTTFQEIQKY